MECKSIIMNHTVPPSLEDLETMANGVLPSMPEELLGHCEGLVVVLEDIVDEAMLVDLNIEDPFELLALYKNGKEISPGIVRKVANDDDVLVLYRRALLDVWCETEEDLQSIIRQVMIEEMGRYFEFSDNDVQDMTEQDYRGVL
ncbi:MAG: metallopeptidase family protein [Alphaproteobacteria bacterium]